jgi:hypothetical protein
MVFNFAEHQIDDKRKESKSDEHCRSDNSKPLVIAQVLTLQVGDPVELGHILIIYNLLA